VTQTPSLARLWRRRKQRGWRSRDRLTHLILGGAIFAGAIASCGSYLWVRKLVLDRARRETLLHLQFHRESIDLWLAARKQEIAQLARSPALQTMYLMLQQEQPEDFAIATGETHKLEDFVAEVFACLDLDWRNHVTIDESLFRPTDIAVSRGNPAKAQQKLGWQATYKMKDIARQMVNTQLASWR